MLAMRLEAGQTLQLTDDQRRRLGQFAIESREGDLLCGRFVAGPDYAAVATLFREFEEAVNCQALSVVDELDAALAALHLRLCEPSGSEGIEIQDAQIWSQGDMTCRLPGNAEERKDGAAVIQRVARPVTE